MRYEVWSCAAESGCVAFWAGVVRGVAMFHAVALDAGVYLHYIIDERTLDRFEYPFWDLPWLLRFTALVYL